MAIVSHHLSTISLKVNELKSPIQRLRVSEWILKSVISNDLPLSSLFVLVKSALKLSACFFISDMCSLAPQFLFNTFLWYLSLCWPCFVQVLFSWCHWVVYLCFLVAHWSLKKLCWILWQCADLYFFGVGYDELLCFFGGVMFPWIFTFLVVLRCCLHIWRSSHLF